MTETVSRSLEGPAPIPAAAGIGLRGPYHAQFLDAQPPVAWLEAHSENFFAEHGIASGVLERIRRDYPLSLHGVGLSIGSTDPLDTAHLEKLDALIRRTEPGLLSEHLSWGSIGGAHLNDLLPLPYTEEALAHIVGRVEQVQDYLGRQILIENVSSYMEFADSAIPEWEFLSAVAEDSGCGLLLDINNVYVNSVNRGFEATTYIDAIAPERVFELHLAGHSTQAYDGRAVLIDTHNAPVCEAVWLLFEHAVRRFGSRPTLIEWDSDFPPLETLLEEAARAQRTMDRTHELAA
jgi:uncharacterized protein (UPF0276 family)